MSMSRKDDNVAFMAGFPNASVDAIDTPLDLNQLVVKNPSSTFFMRIDGEQWGEMNIHTGDVVIVDRSLAVRSSDLIIAQVDGELLMRRYQKKGAQSYLLDATGTRTAVTQDGELEVWGVVTYTFHAQRSDLI